VTYIDDVLYIYYIRVTSKQVAVTRKLSSRKVDFLLDKTTFYSGISGMIN